MAAVDTVPLSPRLYVPHSLIQLTMDQKCLKKEFQKENDLHIACTLYLQVFKQHLQCIRDDK